MVRWFDRRRAPKVGARYIMTGLAVAGYAALAGFAAPLAAQEGPPPMPAREVLHLVFEQGYEPLSPPVRRGGNYTLMAVDAESGIEMRLVVDGWSGAVLRARPRGLDEAPSRRAPGFETARLSPPSVIPAEPRSAPVRLPSDAAPTPKPRPLPRETAQRAEPALPDTKPLEPLAKPGDAETVPAPAPVEARPDAPAKDGASSSGMPPVQPLN